MCVVLYLEPSYRGNNMACFNQCFKEHRLFAAFSSKDSCPLCYKMFNFAVLVSLLVHNIIALDFKVQFFFTVTACCNFFCMHIVLYFHF